MPGLLLGLGLGGLADGISLQQIAQWHHMGSALLPPLTVEAMRQNLLWDGLVLAACLVLAVVGVYLLLRHAREGRPLPSAPAFTGQLVLGWGAFNVAEGVTDHHLLGLHHVRDVPTHMPVYDWVFLAVGVGFVVAGWALSRRRPENASLPQARTVVRFPARR